LRGATAGGGLTIQKDESRFWWVGNPPYNFGVIEAVKDAVRHLPQADSQALGAFFGQEMILSAEKRSLMDVNWD